MTRRDGWEDWTPEPVYECLCSRWPDEDRCPYHDARLIQRDDDAETMAARA